MSFDVTAHWNTLFMHPNRLVAPASWVRHIPLAFLLIDLARPRTLVELGVHTGNSFCAFCQAVHHFQTTTLCYGVDTFQGDPQAGHYEDDVYENLTAHVQHRYHDFTQLLRTTFDEAVTAFTNSSIDLLHIDGLHTYEAVRHDFDTWLPKVSEQGLVLFHDISARHEDFGAWKVWEEIKDAYPSFGFRHGHGLGLLAVGQNIPDPILAFIDALHQNERIEPVFVAAGDRLANALQASLMTERIATLRAECDNLRKHAKLLEQLRLEHEQVIEEQGKHIQGLEQLRLKHEQVIEEQGKHIQGLEQLRLKHEQVIEEQGKHIQGLNAEIAALRASWTWRMTAPLRIICSFFSKHGHIARP